MKLIKLILCLALFLNASAFCREVKFIQITDINLNPENAPKLLATIKEINQYKNIDFVVFGGNNTEKANFENFKTFLYLLKKVHKKKYVLLGSTDVLKSSGLDKQFYYKKIRKSCHFHPKKPNFVFKKKGYRFVVMDGSKQYFQGTNGYYTEEELRWLNKVLSKYKKDKVIILQHFPILPANSEWLTTAGLEDYYEVLKKHDNVKIIISGHYGYNLEQTQGNILHIITEGYNKNRAYKIIQIDLNDKDNFVGTYLVK